MTTPTLLGVPAGHEEWQSVIATASARVRCCGVVGAVAGVLLGAAFLWAGALKLVQGPSWSKQAADMGVARPVALVVPYVEIVVGAALVSTLFAPWPAVVALALLVAYTVLIAVRLADGSRPPCACFGSRSMRPLGGYHVLRNLALIALAVVAILAI
jgi:uncharacterized membrane protein YphA (DoxX/SURF4 family)